MDVHGTFGEFVVGLGYSMFIVTVRTKNHTYRVATSGQALAVHFVPRQAEALARLFGGRTGDEVDRFARCAWQPGHPA